MLCYSILCFKTLILLKLQWNDTKLLWNDTKLLCNNSILLWYCIITQNVSITDTMVIN
jgi:hypothetical protein